MIKQEMNSLHPVPFPLELPERIIKSTEAQVIFDPFMGSGTTAVAAILNSRQFIGAELSPEYSEMANTRIASLMGIQRITNEQKQLQLGL